MIVRLVIPGVIAGKGRPRASVVNGRPRLRTPDSTRQAETRVREAWQAAGSPWMGDGPLTMTIRLWEARPTSHYNTKGELNAAGLRRRYPQRRPDLDNRIKLIADALNGCVWKDDSQVVRLAAGCYWLSDRDGQSHATVEVKAL